MSLPDVLLGVAALAALAVGLTALYLRRQDRRAARPQVQEWPPRASFRGSSRAAGAHHRAAFRAADEHLYVEAGYAYPADIHPSGYTDRDLREMTTMPEAVGLPSGLSNADWETTVIPAVTTDTSTSSATSSGAGGAE